jgi:hypothetical protein
VKWYFGRLAGAVQRLRHHEVGIAGVAEIWSLDLALLEQDAHDASIYVEAYVIRGVHMRCLNHYCQM